MSDVRRNIGSLAGILGFAACFVLFQGFVQGAWAQNPPSKPAPVSLNQSATLEPASPEVLAVARGSNTFAFECLRALAKKESGNIFFSPYSIHTAFAMPFAGALDNTYEEMLNVFQYPVKNKKLAGDFGRYQKSLQGKGSKVASPAYELSMANALWAEKTYPFDPGYLHFVKNVFSSEIQTVDFKNEGAQIRLQINDWVVKLTRDKIKDLIPENVLTPLTRMVLVNAIYFKGTWEHEFNKARTNEEAFTLISSETVQVAMMHNERKFSYFENDLAQGIRLPYKGGDLAMIVLLPRERDGMAKLEAELNPQKLEEWLKTGFSTEVRLSLPKFTMEFGCSLLESMKALGINDAFSEKSANFKKMIDPRKLSETLGLFISEAFHKAFVAVDEEGTEAAAATAIVMSTKSMAMEEEPKIFKADHPFLFCITHEPTSEILFLGRVMNPK